VARMQNATALFMNVVEVEFCELRSSSGPKVGAGWDVRSVPQ
jgi:hypothetical protein